MKTTIFIILVIVSLFFIADISVQFKPFKITFQNLTGAIGAILFMTGLVLINLNSIKKAEQRGFEKGYEATIEEIKETINNMNE